MKSDERNLHYIIRKQELNLGGFALEAIKYLSAQEVSDSWGITKRRVQNLCMNDRIPGAVRIGNMWAIPADALKPKDARMHERTEEEIFPGTLMRKARRELKSIVDVSLRELQKKGLSPVAALQTLVVFFASKLLGVYIDNNEECLNVCECFFGCSMRDNISDSARQNIERYISENGMYLDDSLSWVYQFGTKNSCEFKYKDTQFFTEKYMIKTLVDSLHLDLNSKVIDPACGGGNFLIYSYEVLASNENDTYCMNKAMHALDNLYGYEIDQFLAYIASFNLKIKALAWINKEHEVTINTFNSCHPKIFYPKQDSIPGFLDTEWNEQIVINCDSAEALKLIDVVNEANVVVTNPPFRTIKGMPLEQKTYLQEHYPMAKCDMCNAFIERVMEVLPLGGKAAMVTQNSWMYLDSFTSLRSVLLQDYTINNIWELGSNAFYDLSGEKANIALVTFTKIIPSKEHQTRLCLLRDMRIEQIEELLEKKYIMPISVKQIDVLNNTESRFDMVSTEHLKSLQYNCDQYKEYAVPMQGTSTGDAKNLIDYYWNHIGDNDWVLVSKGGGYSRFEGLNSYCVKWGKNGEYIKNTKGSAIRNADYFTQTQLVFSDTGTAGLNVRVLMPGQIFVASGPGIRINKGKMLAHLAFLNSRLAAFYVRLTSPKLTIAARYIGQIPVTKKLLNSTVLEKSAKECLVSKAHRLSKRPNNIEFSYITHTEDKSILDMARLWFAEDLNDEWTQLLNEQKIEDKISKEMNLTLEDQHAIDSYIGSRIILLTKDDDSAIIDETDFSGILGYDCLPKRTKANKKSLGSDGLIEYISQLKGISCEKVYSVISERYEWFEESYIHLYMHALVLSAMKYRDKKIENLSINNLILEMGVMEDSDVMYAKNWIERHFNAVHNDVFEGKPIFIYDTVRNTLSQIEE